MRASNRALRCGVLLAGLALLACMGLNRLGLPHQLHWLLVLPLAASSYLLISGIFGICIVNGLSGNRHPDHGREVVLDRATRAQMRNRALWAVSASIVLGFALAAAFVSHS